MGIEQILHMNRGDGETSYYHNSIFQQCVLLRARPYLREKIAQLCEKSRAECLVIADMGCSSGPNALLPLWEMIETIDSTCVKLNKKPPVLQAFLNDLPSTDFNTIFGSMVPEFHMKLMEKNKDRTPETCLIGAMPGSFYTTLFPYNSLHFVHSSCSLHWLSQVPQGLVTESGVALNKGNICLTKSSPPIAHELYLDQFMKDFTKFLKLRSQELIVGGGMVLVFPCYSAQYPYRNSEIWELIGLCLQDMVNEGKITQSMLDSCNIAYYPPALEEVRKAVENEGSFGIDRLEEFEVRWDTLFKEYNTEIPHDEENYVAKQMRAVAEQLIASQFGEAIIEDLFHKLSFKAGKGKDSSNFIVVSLTKK